MNENPCTCGNPKIQGVVHTNYGPCYLYEIGQIDGAVDGEGKLLKLEKLKSYDTLAAQLRERLAQAERELSEAKAKVSDLIAERGVLLNGASMVARYALPYFKRLDKKRPSHDTAQLISTATYQAEVKTNETNLFVVEWMTNMKSERDSFRAEADSLREQVAALQTYADMAAGLLAKKGVAWRQGYEAAKAQAYHHLVYVVGDNYNAKSIRDMQPSPRPDAQEAKP